MGCLPGGYARAAALASLGWPSWSFTSAALLRLASIQVRQLGRCRNARSSLAGCRRLLAALRAKFEAAGGAIREHTAFRTADIYLDAVSIRWGC